MSRTREPLWTHRLTPVVTSDPLDAVVGSAWDLVFIGAASSGCAWR